MKRLLPFLFLLFVGCKPDMPRMPSDIMPLTKMTALLADMHLADSIAETKAQGGNLNEEQLTREYYAQIYKNHGITREEFLHSYEFYKTHPAWLNKLYDAILLELSRREADVSK